MTVEEVAREIYERLSQELDGMVIAVWADGTVEVVGFGFRGRRDAEGAWHEPVATYPAKSPMSYREVLERLERGLQKHGHLPPA